MGLVSSLWALILCSFLPLVKIWSESDPLNQKKSTFWIFLQRLFLWPIYSFPYAMCIYMDSMIFPPYTLCPDFGCSQHLCQQTLLNIRWRPLFCHGRVCVWWFWAWRWVGWSAWDPTNQWCGLFPPYLPHPYATKKGNVLIPFLESESELTKSQNS